MILDAARKTLPAPNSGGLYETLLPTIHIGSVEALPSRAFRDGTGTFLDIPDRYRKVGIRDKG
jgi:hypothetical protein